MIKFSMFFHQPFEVNICTNKMTFDTKNCTRQQGLKFKFTKIYQCRQKQQQQKKQTDTKVNNLRHKMPSKCQKTNHIKQIFYSPDQLFARWV